MKRHRTHVWLSGNGRGIIDVIVASSALAIFKAMGEGAPALRGGLLFLSAVTACAGVLCLIFVPNDEKRTGENGKEQNRAQAAFGGMIQALKNIDIWAVALNVSLYTAFTAD